MDERKGLSWVLAVTPGLLVSFLGLVAVFGGLTLFGRGFLTPSAEFFASPEPTMDQIVRNGFLGLVLFGAGGFVLVAGFGMLFAGSAVGLFTRLRGPVLDAGRGYVGRRCGSCHAPLAAMARRCSRCGSPQG